MQAFYSDNINTTKLKLKGSKMSRNESFERSVKRSPYSNEQSTGTGSSNGGGNEGNGILFMLLTILLLLVVWPIGLIMLWTRRFRLGWAGKLLITLVTAVLFCFALVFAANIPSSNPTVKKIQNALNDGFDWVYSQTGGTLDEAGNVISAVLKDGETKLNAIWDQIDEGVANAYLKYYTKAEPGITAVKRTIPAWLSNKYLNYIGYEPPKGEVLEKQNKGDKGVQISGPTPTPTSTLAPVATPTPTPTPGPTPTPAPITLPDIKNVELAPVYYTKGGTYYHLTKNCSGMVNADSHTLKEAFTAGKKTCENCAVVSTDMLDFKDEYFWVDDKNVAHVTDECAEYPHNGRYSIIPFEDVYQGHYTYCHACRADVCYEYMQRNDSRYNISYEELDDSTKLLYDYEKTIIVYYGENSRKYHADTACQMMYDAKYEHNLYEALHTDIKERCNICTAPTEEEAKKQFEALLAAQSGDTESN